MAVKHLVRKQSSPSHRIAQYCYRRGQFIIISTAILIALSLLYFFNPATTSGLYPSSPSRLLFGIYCPGCGTLRGIHQLLHGNVWAALDLNPLMVLAVPFLVYAYFAYAINILLGRRLPQLYIHSRWIWLLLKVVIAYWILRNIPVAPFAWLAP